MDKVDSLLNILQIAREIDNPEIAKGAVVAIAEAYGIVPNLNRYKSIQDIHLYTPLARSNWITMIKELRERAMENGLAYGLREAKEEVDRRIALAKCGREKEPWEY